MMGYKGIAAVCQSQYCILLTCILYNGDHCTHASCSPILAAFQKRPLKPVRSLRRLGNFALMYVHVQIVSRTTVRNALKSNRADMTANAHPLCQ